MLVYASRTPHRQVEDNADLAGYDGEEAHSCFSISGNLVLVNLKQIALFGPAEEMVISSQPAMRAEPLGICLNQLMANPMTERTVQHKNAGSVGKDQFVLEQTVIDSDFFMLRRNICHCSDAKRKQVCSSFKL